MTTYSIGGVAFDGPIALPAAKTMLRGKGGVYLITHLGQVRLDIDHAEDMGSALAGHERRPCWLDSRHDSEISVYYRESYTEGQRMQDEAAVRPEERFPCRAD